MTIIEKGQCTYVKGRLRQSTECLNCKFNRVKNFGMLLRCCYSGGAEKTKGTVCVADEYFKYLNL